MGVIETILKKAEGVQDRVQAAVTKLLEHQPEDDQERTALTAEHARLSARLQHAYRLLGGSEIDAIEQEMAKDNARRLDLSCSCGSRTNVTMRRRDVQWTQQIEWLTYLAHFHRWNDARLNDGEVRNAPKDEEEPKGRMLKVVTVLDVQPGRADAPGVGDPIAILTVEHNGDIESPMMLRLRDVQRLARDLTAVSAHHGDQKAMQIVSEFYSDHFK